MTSDKTDAEKRAPAEETEHVDPIKRRPRGGAHGRNDDERLTPPPPPLTN